MENIEKIVHEFGILIEDVLKRIPTHYPLSKFPRSFLPYKKEIIKMALEEGQKTASHEMQITFIR